MEKATHKDYLSQPLLINRNQFKYAVTFLTGYNDIFEVTNNLNNFYLVTSITDCSNRIFIPKEAYELESVND